jgi:hypothetical protein
MTQQQGQEKLEKKFEDMQIDICKTLEYIHNKISSEEYRLKSEIQEEIAQQITLLQQFEDYVVKKSKKRFTNIVEIKALQSRLKYFTIALDALFLQPSEEKIAKKLRHETEYFLNSKSRFGFLKTWFQRATREFPTPTKVLFGLTMAIPVYAIIIPVSLTTAIVLTMMPDIIQISGYQLMGKAINEYPSPQELKNTEKRVTDNLKQLFDNSSLLIMVAFAGAFGSIVSIFIRLDQYKTTDYKGSATPILVGFSKPLIGTAFGILVFAMINSNIITFPILQGSGTSESNSNNKYFVFFTLAFLFGFSERLANDIVRRAEDTLSPQDKTESSTTQQKITEKIVTEKSLKVPLEQLSLEQLPLEQLQLAYDTIKLIKQALLARSQHKDKIEGSTTQQNPMAQFTDAKTEETTIETTDTEIKKQTT